MIAPIPMKIRRKATVNQSRLNKPFKKIVHEMPFQNSATKRTPRKAVSRFVIGSSFCGPSRPYHGASTSSSSSAVYSSLFELSSASSSFSPSSPSNSSSASTLEVLFGLEEIEVELDAKPVGGSINLLAASRFWRLCAANPRTAAQISPPPMARKISTNRANRFDF